jgi:deazaflavin-dependent oxidoreductase (nitroreductase family)
MPIQKTLFRATLRAHEFVYEKTDGLIGHKVLGVPTLMLRTKGRRSGQSRTSSLVYIEDGDRLIVVASKGGDPRPPAWLLNLRADPDVEVQVARDRWNAKATEIAHDDPEFPRLWKRSNDANGSRYDAYQKLTDRPIPLVALTRA